MSEEDSIQLEVVTQTSRLAQYSDGDWLCAWCHARVADDEDRFNFDGKSEFTFTNPDGAQFDIILFSSADSCEKVGAPALEHTWFEGCAWSYCQCGECNQHLGWFYEGAQDFVGLIRARLLKGTHARN